MRPAREGDIPVRVKNSYNPLAPGTLITRTRDMTKVGKHASEPQYIFYWLAFITLIAYSLLTFSGYID